MAKKPMRMPKGGTRWANAIHSESLAVHPSQIAEAREHARRHGVPTEFDTQGRPILTSRSHKRAYAHSRGCVVLDDYHS